jgi:DeoR/GlpR family transcriptional regulator of sugar metabolism
MTATGSRDAGRGSPSSRPQLAEARRAAIVTILRDQGSVSVTEVEERFGVSSMTARRDLGELERAGVARRTHGGAVLPAFAAREDSFTHRLALDAEAKAGLAGAALGLLSPQQTVFLDSSSTTYYLARRIADSEIDVTVITNSVPVMEVLSGSATFPGAIVGIGGTLRQLTRSFVGPYAVRTIFGHYADVLFFSVKGVTPGGMLTDADMLEAEVKRAMIAQAERSVLLVDRTKLSARGQNAIVEAREISTVLTHGVQPLELAPLQPPGVSVQMIDRGD